MLLLRIHQSYHFPEVEQGIGNRWEERIRGCERGEGQWVGTINQRARRNSLLSILLTCTLGLPPFSLSSSGRSIPASAESRGLGTSLATGFRPAISRSETGLERLCNSSRPCWAFLGRPRKGENGEKEKCKIGCWSAEESARRVSSVLSPFFGVTRSNSLFYVCVSMLFGVFGVTRIISVQTIRTSC